MAHDVFISHSSNNRTIASAVCAALESTGIRCWMAPRDVLPGRSYSGEITRAIQQSRAFVLIFSAHSNNSEQVLREVQLAANFRLHIVQFRIDSVTPSDDLEYYLSGPHWLDAVTPPLENHLEQLKSSMTALLALPRASDGGSAPPPVLKPPPPLPPSISAVPPTVAAKSSTNNWKWVVFAGLALLVVGTVIVIAGVVVVRSKSAQATTTATMPAAPRNAKTEQGPVPQVSTASRLGNSLLTAEEAEVYVKEVNREMERGDLQAVLGHLDDTVDYYAFGPKDKAFIGELTRQYFAAIPVRAFAVGEIKVQPGPRPNVTTVVFDTRYSVRDALGIPATGHTRTEWDVVRRSDALKIVRTNWITYPDTTPSPP